MVSSQREYGYTTITKQKSPLFQGIRSQSLNVWMSHGR